MAEEIKKQYGVDATMIEGRGGVFDVKLDGTLIYSKHETGEFPEHGLILGKIAASSKR